MEWVQSSAAICKVDACKQDEQLADAAALGICLKHLKIFLSNTLPGCIKSRTFKISVVWAALTKVFIKLGPELIRRFRHIAFVEHWAHVEWTDAIVPPPSGVILELSQRDPN